MAFKLLSVKLLSLGNRILTFRCNILLLRRYSHCFNVTHSKKKHKKTSLPIAYFHVAWGWFKKRVVLTFWFSELIWHTSLTHTFPSSTFSDFGNIAYMWERIIWLCEYCVRVNIAYRMFTKSEHCEQMDKWGHYEHTGRCCIFNKN